MGCGSSLSGYWRRIGGQVSWCHEQVSSQIGEYSCLDPGAIIENRMKINGDMVRALREQKSWSQEHFASASGLSDRTIQRVEAEWVASAETRLALAAALNVPVSTLAVQSSDSIGERATSWRVPVWGWLGWILVTGGVIGAVTFGSTAGPRPLLMMALNIFPWLVLIGISLAVFAAIGAWQRSRAPHAKHRH